MQLDAAIGTCWNFRGCVEPLQREQRATSTASTTASSHQIESSRDIMRQSHVARVHACSSRVRELDPPVVVTML
jgi:hypothetical protein